MRNTAYRLGDLAVFKTPEAEIEFVAPVLDTYENPDGGTDALVIWGDAGPTNTMWTRPERRAELSKAGCARV